MKAMRKFTQNGALGILPLLTSLMILVLAGCELESSSGGSGSDGDLTDSGADADSGEEQTYSNISVEFSYASDATIPAKRTESGEEPDQFEVEVSGYKHLYSSTDSIYALFCIIGGEDYNCNANFFENFSAEDGDFDDLEHSWSDSDGNTREVYAEALFTPGTELDVTAASLSSDTFTSTHTNIGGLLMPVKAEIVTVSTLVASSTLEEVELLRCKGSECETDIASYIGNADANGEVLGGTMLGDLDGDGLFNAIEIASDSTLSELVEIPELYALVDNGTSEDATEEERTQLSPFEWIMGYQAYLIPLAVTDSTSTEPDSTTITLADEISLSVEFSEFNVTSAQEGYVDLADGVPFFALPNTELSASE